MVGDLFKKNSGKSSSLKPILIRSRGWDIITYLFSFGQLLRTFVNGEGCPNCYCLVTSRVKMP